MNIVQKLQVANWMGNNKFMGVAIFILMAHFSISLPISLSNAHYSYAEQLFK